MILPSIRLMSAVVLPLEARVQVEPDGKLKLFSAGGEYEIVGLVRSEVSFASNLLLFYF